MQGSGIIDIGDDARQTARCPYCRVSRKKMRMDVNKKNGTAVAAEGKGTPFV